MAAVQACKVRQPPWAADPLTRLTGLTIYAERIDPHHELVVATAGGGVTSTRASMSPDQVKKALVSRWLSSANPTSFANNLSSLERLRSSTLGQSLTGVIRIRTAVQFAGIRQLQCQFLALLMRLPRARPRARLAAILSGNLSEGRYRLR
jgi:hypothetical protein